MRRGWICLVAVWALTAEAQTPEPPKVDDVLAKLDDLFRSKSSVGRMDVTVTGPRTSRSMRIKSWTRGEDEALIVIEAPAREAGIATLKVKNNLWNYLPKVSRTIRVPPSMMLGSWMGTDFTNDDLVRESSYRKDFDARMDGRTEDGRGWKISATAKPGVVGRWAKLDLFIDDELIPTRITYFDRKGRLARTMIFDEVRVLGGRKIPARMTLTPADVEGQKTEMRYLEVQFDVPVSDDTFSLARLEQNR